ncbi:MAG TPA: Crp/Fnr family transcriptional regulator [Caulobacteraceae bacterium]|nr:Crp/Fnr family transcriptional regulator [Caulobacteraceae bacterium]
MLAAQAWLKGPGGDLVDPLMAEGRLVALAPGQWSHAEGDDDTGVLVVVEGALQVFAQAPGDREVLINQVGAGAALGQTVRLGGGPRLTTAVSVGESLVLVVPDRSLGRIAATRPHIWQAVASLLYLQLRGLVQMAAEAAALPPRQRLAARLERLARGGDGTLGLTQQALAEMTGLSRKSVNAFLGEFARAGLVARTYGQVAVLDAAGLRKVAAG